MSSAGPPVWWVAEPPTTAGTEVRTAWSGGRWPDGHVLPAAAAGADELAGATRRATLRWQPATRRVLHCRLAPGIVGGDPALWFVALPEPGARPAALTLVGFRTPDRAPGSVLTGEAFTAVAVRSDAQAGAVRWFTEAGLVHQVYVSPDERRRGVGTALVYTAALWCRLMGWPLLRGDGQRTDLGEAWLRTVPWPDRIPPRTKVLPPMTPGDA